ncbi:hypothetical protein RB2654_14700 [Rhodobacterales bacterium HTCC2654]|uniref:Uncharacterized protein n=1 Tax=Maritimibacter alkaliphilus HTCC2654 TaxID=314271 RepID=A3VGY9_9RHOB|nr:hypothetical protein RB2654_14700 [Rhodobacterales bacterium HTCC2654] [Maritimibacter alkaliphilus HTCC2654]
MNCEVDGTDMKRAAHRRRTRHCRHDSVRRSRRRVDPKVAPCCDLGRSRCTRGGGAVLQLLRQRGLAPRRAPGPVLHRVE